MSRRPFQVARRVACVALGSWLLAAHLGVLRSGFVRGLRERPSKLLKRPLPSPVARRQRGPPGSPTPAQTAPPLREVPRVDADAVSRQELEALVEEGPVLLSGLFEDSDTEQWCRDLRQAVGRKPVVCKQQVGSPSDNRAWEVALDEFLDEEVLSSSHGRPRYLFEEDLLFTPQAQMAGLPRRARLPEHLFGKNWFEYFPEELQPSPCCLVAAGEGARSTLHRDPFEWTGTSLCLHGTKLWTFLPPGEGGVRAVDDALQAYRFPYEGFDLDGQSLAAGWQADLDLYARRAPECEGAGALRGMPAADRLRTLEAVAAELRQWWAERGAAAARAPKLQPPPELVARLPEDVVPTCALQRKGDLLLIPAHWWHQTYALEPSLAVSGQYMNEANSDRVIGHISEWCGSAVPPSEQLQRLPPRQKVLNVLEAALLGQDPPDLAEAQPWGDGPDDEGDLELFFSADEGDEDGLYFPVDDLE